MGFALFILGLAYCTGSVICMIIACLMLVARREELQIEINNEILKQS